MKLPAFALLFAALCPAQPLRNAAAARAIMIGAAAGYDFLNESDYAAALAREYNLLEPENDAKWPVIHPAKDVYDFRKADGVAAFARENGMFMRGHTLVWHNAIPAWLSSGNFSSAQLAAILQDHINTVLGRYAGTIYSWDVVNEAFNDDGTFRDSLWYNQPGIGLAGKGAAYIERALSWARQADPNALLFYNDYNAEAINAKSDAIYAMAKDFKARGAALDGIGLQMHLTLNGVSLAGLDANIQRLTALGLLVHITEFDVRAPVNNGAASDADLNAQARIYHDVTAVCLKYPLCEAVQSWGFTDRHSWIPAAFPGFGAALPSDMQYRPKPAYAALLDALRNAPPTLAAAGIVNGASYTGGPVSPGEIIAVFGANYGPPELAGLQLDENGRVSTNLAGARVLFDGVPAPVIYSQVGQAGAVAPYSIRGKLETKIQYEYNGVVSNPVSLPVAESTPAIFSLDTSGSGPGAILNQDFSVNQASRPAAKGSVIQIFATGGGATDPAGVDGQLAGAALPRPVLPVTATIDGQTADVLYAGGAPGLVAGVLQVNVRIPAGASSGAVPVIVAVGGNASPAGVTVAVR